MVKPAVSLVCDVEDSFMHDHIPALKVELESAGYVVDYCRNTARLIRGDVAFFLSCSTILKEEQLAFHAFNVIVHPSRLPEGRGSGVVVWKVLEGADRIWITLFKPTSKLDAGEIYYQECFELSGDELCDEIRQKQADCSFRMLKRFLADYPDLRTTVQKGSSSFYGKRKPKDSELDVKKSIEEQFNLLRVADNKRYPAFFHMKGKKYILKISKEGTDGA